MKKWIKSLRLPIVFMAGLLTFASFKSIGCTQEAWLPALSVFVIGCATMAQNDWRDRRHDLRKRKNLAAHRPIAFFTLVLALWGIAAAMTIVVWRCNHGFGAMSGLMIFIGLVYSEARLIPFLPTALVAVSVAIPPLFPIAGGYSSSTSWLLGLAAGLVIFGREIVKDLDDLAFDGDYKWTLPNKIGVSRSRAIAAVAVIGGWIVAGLIDARILFAFPFLAASMLCLFFSRASFRVVKILLDIGMATAILVLLFRL